MLMNKKRLEYRIKKFLEKKLSINEELLPNFLRRRFNRETMVSFVDGVMKIISCEDSSDEFEFGDESSTYLLMIF